MQPRLNAIRARGATRREKRRSRNRKRISCHAAREFIVDLGARSYDFVLTPVFARFVSSFVIDLNQFRFLFSPARVSEVELIDSIILNLG